MKKDKRLEIRLSENDENKLKELCENTGLNKSNVILIAVNNFYNISIGVKNE